MSARVSVVVRTKDRPDFLLRALADVSKQRFADWEILVVNDGGDRARVDRVVAASAVAGRVRVLDVVGTGGRCAAANLGVREAIGEYVVLHDDDDMWDPEFLSVTSSWLDLHPADAGVIVSTAIIYETRRDGRWQEQSRVPFWEGMARVSLSEMLTVNRAVPISFLYRRAVHEQIGWYDEALDAVEDWELLLRLLPAHGIGYVDGPALAYWTQRPDATGTHANSMFALADQHLGDDALVRDRALAAWVQQNGIGLPLYIAGLEKRLAEHIDASIDRLRDQVRADIDAHQPIASRLRRLRRRLGRRG